MSVNEEKPINEDSAVENNVNEDDEEDIEKIFEVMHHSVDSLHNRFEAFYDDPSKEKFHEYDELIKEYISVIRELKNMAKSLLPKSDKKALKIVAPGNSPETIQEPKLERQTTESAPPQEKKKRGRKTKSN